MNIAIEGCLHGELQQVYNRLSDLQKRSNSKIDLLLICGDFQAMRTQRDLQYLHCPPKYRTMGSFHKYYSGQKLAPFLTIFITGNHEAVNSMRESYFGGWVARNIYYLGQAGSLIVQKSNTRVRVCGLSGIYNHRDFQYSLKMEKVPFQGMKDKISAYHVKQLEVFRIQLLGRMSILRDEFQTKLKTGYSKEKGSQVIDSERNKEFGIFLSHDWPQDIALYGDTEELLRVKPFLRQQIKQSTLGSPPSMRLMKILKPQYWFSAHMHVKFPALFPHQDGKYTHFLALDKCLGSRSCFSLLKFKQKCTMTPQEQQSNQKQRLPENTTIEAQSSRSINPHSKKSQFGERLQEYNMFQKITSQQPQVYLLYDQDWLTVLNLTAQLQTQSQIYYKYEKNMTLKCQNSALMNKLLQKFVEDKLQTGKRMSKQDLVIRGSDIGKDLNHESIQEQYQQTKKILGLAGVDWLSLRGIVFPAQEHQQITNVSRIEKGLISEQNDQIELDL